MFAKTNGSCKQTTADLMRSSCFSASLLTRFHQPLSFPHSWSFLAASRTHKHQQQQSWQELAHTLSRRGVVADATQGRPSPLQCDHRPHPATVANFFMCLFLLKYYNTSFWLWLRLLKFQRHIVQFVFCMPKRLLRRQEGSKTCWYQALS